MQPKDFFFVYILLALMCFPIGAFADDNCYLINECSHFRRDPSSPSPGTQIKINPSAVPTDKGIGIEGIYFSGGGDVSLVRGNGRMGASISPSNSEETFFGAPGFELDRDLIKRKQDQEKYPSQKVTLATAFDIAERKGSGFNRYALKVGLMGKYNTHTSDVTPGAGITGILGPFTAGYSIYNDSTQLELNSNLKETLKYQVQTYNIGLYLNSLILNYSNLRLQSEDKSYLATVHVYTASLSLGKFIFTGSKRSEDSPAPYYNYDTEMLEMKKIKEEYFGGIQYSLSNNFMLGFLYNYYLLREYSATATVFF